MRELWARIVETSGAKIYGLVLGIVSLSLTSRMLGPEGRGTIAALTTWVTGFMTFGNLSLGQVAIHRLAEDRAGQRYGAILGSLLSFALAITLLGWCVAAAMRSLWLSGPLSAFSPAPLILSFAALPFLISEQYGTSLLMALERLQVANRFQVIGRTLAVASLYVFLRGFGWSVPGALAANLLGQVVVGLGGATLLFGEARHKGLRAAATAPELRALLVGGGKLHVNAIGTFLLSSANILLLHRFMGPGETGLFAMANQLIGIMAIVPQSASMVVYGRVAQLGPDRAWAVNRRVLLQVGALMLMACALSALLAPVAITLLAGASFSASVPMFRWLLLTIPGSTLSAMMAPQWIGRGYFVLAASVTLLIGLVSLGANFVLIGRYGVAGAIVASIVTYGVSLICNGLMFIHCEARTRGVA